MFAWWSVLCLASAMSLVDGRVSVSLILEPFDWMGPDEGETNKQAYNSGNVTFAKTDHLQVETVNSGLFGHGALRLTLQAAAGVGSSKPHVLTWITDPSDAPFNCYKAKQVSLWFRVPSPQPTANMTLALLDDSQCATNCSLIENLLVHESEIIPLEYTGQGEWKEIALDLDHFGSEVQWDHIRGWRILISDSAETNSPSVFEFDQLACVGSGDLMSSAFYSTQDANEAFDQAMETRAWVDEYYRSGLSANQTQAVLRDGMFQFDPYLIEQTEEWGGHVGLTHVVPGNGYYNVSQAMELKVDYSVKTACSSPGRAHLRLIVLDGSSCTSQCSDYSTKNLEAYYSFNFILDDVQEAGSFRVPLEGSDDPESPFWLTGWLGSVHDAVLDKAFIKGFMLQMSLDSQGGVGSTVEGAIAFGGLEATDGFPVDTSAVPDSAKAEDSDTEAEISLVLEPFDVFVGPDAFGSALYDPGNVTFEVSDPGKLLVEHADGLFGDGSLNVTILNSLDVTTLTWTTPDNEAAFNCINAERLSLWVKVVSPQPTLRMMLTLLDDSACHHNCSSAENLVKYPIKDFSLSYDEGVEWEELNVNLEQYRRSVRLDHIRGWQLLFDATIGPTTIQIDQLSCVGLGDLASSALHYNGYVDNAFEHAIETHAWVDDYYRSGLSANQTQVLLDDGMFQLDPYVIEQTEEWGGFVSLTHIVPGNGYYNFSLATELNVEYNVTQESSSAGRAHFRLKIFDGSACPTLCSDYSVKNLEAFYSFNFILDVVGDGTLSIPLQGNVDPESPFWLTGRSGSVHNGNLDQSHVKGFAFELSLDSQGGVSSVVEGSAAFGRLNASRSLLAPVAEAKTPEDVALDGVIEHGISFARFAGPNSRRVEFTDIEGCISLCMEDPACLYGYSSGRDCFLASFLLPRFVLLTSTVFQEETNDSFWMNGSSRRGDYCKLCACDELTRSIDCSKRDLAILPETFTANWSPKSLDLSGNPRLLVIGSGALNGIAESLEKIVFPEGLLYLSPESATSFPNLGTTGSTPKYLKNAIKASVDSFSDVCCSPATESAGFTFCEMKPDRPGVDSVLLNFTQYIDLESDALATLLPRSSFGAEASESPQKCAEYCRLFPECRYFSYDARYHEAEHRCYLLHANGTKTENVCCEEGDYADLEQTLPGWTSGVAPRTRNELFGAHVLVSETSLRADEANDFEVNFQLSLGAKPKRGAVWIEPQIASMTALNYSLIPERVVLYEDGVSATVSLRIYNSELVAGVGETLVIINSVESCDSAFTATDDPASSVLVRVVVPQVSVSSTSLIIGAAFGLAALVIALSAFLFVDRRQLAKRAARNDLDVTERDEIFEVQRLIQKDNFHIVIGRVVIATVALASCFVMPLWLHSLHQKQRSESSDSDESQSVSRGERAYLLVLCGVLLLMLAGFFAYDWLIRKRNRKLVVSAAKSSEIMTALFPDGIRERLLNETRTAAKADNAQISNAVLADLYPRTTVCFLDIVGFTSWCSSRQPIQVFQLLEAVFGRFDVLAKRHKVYKVETVGDCFVCITGAPVEQPDHAQRMCTFASKCMNEFSKLSRKLVMVLGPDTSELQLRAGIHSGQVTMGVLRGDRARYQLFGDCVNTGKIQLSGETADLLRKSGRGFWTLPRKSDVVAKGKGKLATFWLDTEAARKDTVDDASSVVTDLSGYTDNQIAAHDRLIEWNAQQLISLLKKIVAFRQKECEPLKTGGQIFAESAAGVFSLEVNKTYLDEVAEVIQLPKSEGLDIEDIDVSGVFLSRNVEDEMRTLVKRIAAMYNNNPFHNFEHASHVTLSILKLLSRIEKPSRNEKCENFSLHDHSYGITHDPLTHFAVAFCGLIHDVPNAQLWKEDPELSARFEGRSIAEQNSLAQCFDLLTKYEYRNLRMHLFRCNEDQERFRQLVINSVMATDIVDKELKAARNARWEKAFKVPSQSETRTDINRKATIVIEHLIQASDVAHTMQHWDVYTKWNERLLREMYKAYVDGRSENDPRVGWAKGEIGFFDFYIIPLAKKLKECGVFGVSSDEYLNYALINRRKWEEEGAAITAAMVARLDAPDDESSVASKADCVAMDMIAEAMSEEDASEGASEQAGVHLPAVVSWSGDDSEDAKLATTV